MTKPIPPLKVAIVYYDQLAPLVTMSNGDALQDGLDKLMESIEQVI